jgi:hypothetical protein
MTSIQEAQQLLEQAKHDEAARAAAAKAAAKEHDKAVAAFERAEEPRVRDLEHRVAEAPAVQRDDAVAPLRVRRVARAYLLGQLVHLPELLGPETLIVQADEIAARFYSLAVEAVGTLERLTDMSADVWLPGDHELVGRADACERQAWAAFIQRVKMLAGEL